jgi:D-beta-D-heptose 7-phosphate kinase/D-beta-D-heptose 1-phosphate adenosyltransferase
VQIVRVAQRRVAPGGAANVAANVVALGGEARLVGVAGTDAAGASLRAAMTGAGVEDRWLLGLPDRRTTTKTRVLTRGQQVVRIDEEEDAPLDPATADRLLKLATEVIAVSDALLLEDYDKGVLVPGLIGPVIELARARGIPVVVDPKFRSFFGYAGATMLKPNRRELAAALPGVAPTSDRDLIAAADQLAVDHLLLTLGAEGMVLASRAGAASPCRIRSIAREVFDVSGAGDTVTAWAGATLAAGGSALEAALVANLAASVEVGKAGVATVSPDEVLSAWT